MNTGYTITASYFHWIVAAPLIASIGSVLKAQSLPKEDKQGKGLWMHRHKSMGLLTGMVVAPRFALRLIKWGKFSLPAITGTGPVEHKLAQGSHTFLYGFMTIMPATGIAMGYYGGKGMPFFSTTFRGAIPKDDEEKKQNGAIAKQSFSIHKQIGTYGKYLIPLHVAAAFQHTLRGHAIFSRISPFRNVPKH